MTSSILLGLAALCLWLAGALRFPKAFGLRTRKGGLNGQVEGKRSSTAPQT